MSQYATTGDRYCPGCGKWECRHEAECPKQSAESLTQAIAACIDARTPAEQQRDAALGWKTTTAQFIPPPDRPIIGPSEAEMRGELQAALWQDWHSRDEPKPTDRCARAVALWRAWRVLNGRE
jgi:hypothetical protein